MMNNLDLTPLRQILGQHHDQILDGWHSEVSRQWHQHYPNFVQADALRSQMDRLLLALAEFLTEHKHDGAIHRDAPLAQMAITLFASHARDGFRPSDTAQYLTTLKSIMSRLLLESKGTVGDELVRNLLFFAELLDRLSILTFESFVENRERIIAQQGLSLVELSSPVVRLWEQIILVPLVGVIDTVRARQFTERLLEAITRHEAQVTIIDVTGVPVFDTGVARHIMKAVEAAQLLGSRIVITGLSPEGAQTLTKLNVSFGNVISRASLRAGFAEALRLVGRRVVRLQEPAS
jgi:rsbT co-antagonist protein RsbR